jgi:hypothetical protein
LSYSVGLDLSAGLAESDLAMRIRLSTVAVD